MELIDRAKRYLAEHQVPERRLSLGRAEFPDIETQANRIWSRGSDPWRVPSIAEALGVPGIQRCVTLISNTTGSLSMQAFRNGNVMGRSEGDAPPPLVTRPDPYCTTQVFYRDSAFNMASRGEVVWWIASRDADNKAAALVVVPLRELQIESNERNRLRPTYRWGDKVSTRWSPATQDGDFVHVTYLKEPGELRGMGPLQMGGAAVSVSVESQEWAANFYSRGGASTVELHTDMDLDDNESFALKAQWSANPPNVPQVTTGDMEVKDHDINPQGAQMLDARNYQDGEAARLFGVPGTLLEYSSAGSSLTYQNITEVFTLFVKTCLAVNYLEPIEQAMSDLLTRSTVARFNVEGFLRSDIKTRFEVYTAAVGLWGQEEAAQWAREQEGRAPGNVEFAPVPFAPPAAIASSLPVLMGGVRCTGLRMLHGKMVECGKKLAEAGSFVGTCPRCRKEYAAA